jgi:hypothetical protein
MAGCSSLKRSEKMVNKLNGTTQIWADGYSFREVTEKLATALGICVDGCQSAKPEPNPTAQNQSNGEPADR